MMTLDTVASRFSFRSASMSLDFAATLMFREGPVPQERLDRPESLSLWLVEARILDVPPAASEQDLAVAIRLREAIYRLCSGVLAGQPMRTADRRLVNRFGAQPLVTVSLARSGHITKRGDIRSGMAVVARDAVLLLGGPDLARLRQCARHGCTRLFVDRSRGENRTWCGMRECGNRVNAAAYRRRHRAPDPP